MLLHNICQGELTCLDLPQLFRVYREMQNDLRATISEEMSCSCWVLAVAAGLLAGDMSNL